MKKTLIALSAAVCCAVFAQSSPRSTANITFHVKIPSFLSANEMTFDSKRIIYVRSNVRSYCVEYYDPQGRLRPVLLNGRMQGSHCFNSQQRPGADPQNRDTRHEVSMVDPAWWMVVREQP